MEPIDGAGQFGKDLPEPIATSNMRELMSKYDAEPVLGPLSSAGRQYDRRPGKTPHVSGMERASRRESMGTGRSIPREREHSETCSVQDCVVSGTAREEIRARRKKAQDKAKQDKKKTGEPDQQNDIRQLVESWRGSNRVNDCRGKRLRSSVGGEEGSLDSKDACVA